MRKKPINYTVMIRLSILPPIALSFLKNAIVLPGVYLSFYHPYLKKSPTRKRASTAKVDIKILT